jgi:plastocyanin
MVTYLLFPIESYSLEDSNKISILGESYTIAANAATPFSKSILVPPSFYPPFVCIAVNKSVIWTNNDTVNHIVFSNASTNGFDSGIIGPSHTFTQVFNTVGNYTYFEKNNLKMQGLIAVVSDEKLC